MKQIFRFGEGCNKIEIRNEKLSFRCSACKQVSEKIINVKAGFQLLAYEDFMDWSDFTQDVPDRTSTIPSCETIHKIWRP